MGAILGDTCRSSENKWAKTAGARSDECRLSPEWMMLLGKGMALQRDLPSIVPIKAWKEVPGFGQIEKGSLPQQGRELGYVGYATPEDWLRDFF